jgi:HSP90 family molecular chaperone
MKADELIGQFGRSLAFMVAEWIRDIRSFSRDSTAAAWFCTGSDTFTVEPAEAAAMYFCDSKPNKDVMNISMKGG